MSAVITLLFAAFAFLLAGFFWTTCLLSRIPATRILVFWYAVVFNNAGYFLLVFYGVTFF